MLTNQDRGTKSLQVFVEAARVYVNFIFHHDP